MKEDFLFNANLFTGTVPSQIGLLLDMEDTLRVDGNQLVGVPTQLGNLVDLTRYLYYENQAAAPTPLYVVGSQSSSTSSHFPRLLLRGPGGRVKFPSCVVLSMS